MPWFATDPKVAEQILRAHIRDTAILHTIVGVGKRCLFCTRDALYLVSYRRWLPILTPRPVAVLCFPIAQILDLTLEERGDGTVCRLGIATHPAHLPPDGRVPDEHSILFVTLLDPGYKETIASVRYLVESAQFKASWESGAHPGPSKT